MDNLQQTKTIQRKSRCNAPGVNEANKKKRQGKYFSEFAKIVSEKGGVCLGTADDYVTVWVDINVLSNIFYQTISLVKH